jgi:hypothetical protein
MSGSVFAYDISAMDAQGTVAMPLSAECFDIDTYACYVEELEKRCALFAASSTGVLVHRRFRVPECFSWAAADMKTSLNLQLGALDASRSFLMDVPNFLEPWYGIGVVSSAFGAEYVWPEKQAPVTKPVFQNLDTALDCEPTPLEFSPIGCHTMEMLEYFLEATRGKIPISCSDVQSPLNATCALFPTSVFFMAVLDRPDDISILLDRVTDLELAFYQKQVSVIGDALVRPGHGFASSRYFKALGASDDNAVMVSPDTYGRLFGPALARFGRGMGGTAFHSCGNWTTQIAAVKALSDLAFVDAAFTIQTDPDPNPPEEFCTAFSGSGVTVNARMVGNPREVTATFARLNSPAMKTIVVTYCTTPEDQQRAYDCIGGIVES